MTYDEIGIGTYDVKGIYKLENRIYIPSKVAELKLRFMATAHCETNGDRGREVSKNRLEEQVTWTELESDVDNFIGNCLHCIVSRSGGMIPRPLANSLHATKPNEVLQFDFLYMGRSNGREKYVLILKDDLSSYLFVFGVI